MSRSYTSSPPCASIGVLWDCFTFTRGSGYSVSVVSNYRLDGRGYRSPAGAKDFSSSLYVQISSEAHSASYPMGTRGPFPGVKRGWGVTLTTQTI
jgi:hypothetical protein